MDAESFTKNIITRLEMRIKGLGKRASEMDERVPSLGGTKTYIQGKQDGLREAIAYIKEEILF